MGCTGRCIPHPSRVPLSRAAGPSRRLRAAVPLGGGSGGAQREGWTDLAAAPGPPLRSCTALRAGAQAQSRTADRAGHSSSDAAGLGELGPTIDGQPWTVCTLQEGESRAFTCRVPQPVPGATLAWYLNGQRQEANLSAAGTASTLTLTARRSDHQLNCSLTDPASEETYNASVLLNVQYKPEILRAGAHYQEVEGSGLLLVLFVLVQANPPASITWVDQDGHVMANASEFLLLGATHYPGLANHSLHIHLSSVAGNFSVSAANSVGITTTSLLPTGPGRAEGSSPPSRCSRCSGSEHPQPQGTRLPRQTRSLPPDLHLSDLAQEDGASPKDVGAGARGEDSALPGLENYLVLNKLAPNVWAHLQSAQRKQRRDLAVSRGAHGQVPGPRYVPAPGAGQPRVPGRLFWEVGAEQPWLCATLPTAGLKSCAGSQSMFLCSPFTFPIDCYNQNASKLFIARL
ncbi:transmembrane protein 25 isoform X2 [Neopelma chrysocephalum]|uniref:transmembrane protein 25 isoform X2 n=1 Tax=Neopelma chrysocephalum TaxID=114329 RepID=UPI000FCD019B|nr:transmembrane protein 25 isoform X2 [Neopelma chrysocephalum]